MSKDYLTCAYMALHCSCCIHQWTTCLW